MSTLFSRSAEISDEPIGSSGNFSLIFSGVAICAILWFAPGNRLGLPENSVHGLALAAMVMFWWITSAMPPGLAATFFITAVAGLNVLPSEKLLGGAWATSTIWFVIASFGIGTAITTTTLGERVLWLIQPILEKGPLAAVPFFTIVSLILSILGMAGDFARYAMIFPIFIAIAQRSERAKLVARSMALLLLLVGPVTQLAVLNGIWLNPTMVKLSGHDPVSYFAWIAYFFFPSVVYSILSGYIFYFVFRKDARDIAGVFADHSSNRFEIITGREKRLILYISLAIIMWVTSMWTHLDPGWVALFIICIICMPQSGIISFRQFLAAVNWPVVLFLGGAFALAAVMKYLGLARWVESFMVPYVGAGNSFLLGIEVSIYSMVMHLATGDAGSAMAVTVPIFSSIARKNHLPGLLYGWIAYASIFIQTFFLYQQASVLFAYGFGLFRKKDILVLGLFQVFSSALIIGLGTVLWWRIIGKV